MQKDHKFFEDIARMASSAGGTLMEMKREMEAMVTTQVEKMLRRMDLVTREDFNLVREMAVKARTEQEKLAARVAELEKQLHGKAKPSPKPGAKVPPKAAGKKAADTKKPPAKKAATKK